MSNDAQNNCNEQHLQKIGAYLDGEMSAAKKHDFEQALAENPKLSELLREQQQLRQHLQATFEQLDQQPMPSNLMELLQSDPSEQSHHSHQDQHTTNTKANVIKLASTTSANTADKATDQGTNNATANRTTWLRAASVIFIALFSVYLFNDDSSVHTDEITSTNEGSNKNTATDWLNRALDSQLSGELYLAANQQTALLVNLSFSNYQGQFCREYLYQSRQDNSQSATQHRIACRIDGQWQTQAEATAQAALLNDLNEFNGANESTQTFRPAAGESASNAIIEQYLDQHMASDAFSHDDEQNKMLQMSL